MAESNELGQFLRSRREHTKPADVGLPAAGRRRTPGLRREEVATLAGVSVDYLVRLEQGRDRNPSPAVVTALAGALRLGTDEHRHLKKLAQCESVEQHCTAASRCDDLPVEVVAATTRAVLDRLDPTPALVVGPWSQVLAHNRGWERVVRPLGLLDREPPNLAAFTFLDPRSAAAYPAWDAVADEQVAVLRAAWVRWRRTEALEALLHDLLEVPAFASRWEAHGVAVRRRGETALDHPDAGRLRMSYEVLEVDDELEQRMIVWVPADEATDTALARLAGAPAGDGPARLRVVGG